MSTRRSGSTGGCHPGCAFPPRPTGPAGRAPLGEHTDAILAEFGYSDTERDALKAAGVVRQFDLGGTGPGSRLA